MPPSAAEEVCLAYMLEEVNDLTAKKNVCVTTVFCTGGCFLHFFPVHNPSPSTSTFCGKCQCISALLPSPPFIEQVN